MQITWMYAACRQILHHMRTAYYILAVCITIIVALTTSLTAGMGVPHIYYVTWLSHGRCIVCGRLHVTFAHRSYHTTVVLAIGT